MKRALILDTNIYLNFFKYNEKDEHNFYKLLQMSYFEFDLFIPDIVLEEWNDNKYKVIEEKKKVLENIRKSVDINKDMNSIMEGITKEIDESFKLLNRVINAEYLTRRMDYLSELINRARIIESKNFLVYESVIEKTINHSPPFFNKNKKMK